MILHYEALTLRKLKQTISHLISHLFPKQPLIECTFPVRTQNLRESGEMVGKEAEDEVRTGAGHHPHHRVHLRAHLEARHPRSNLLQAVPRPRVVAN